MTAQFKTADDLQEHYWSVIVPMVRKYNVEHGTDVKPWECVRGVRPTGHYGICHSLFDSHHEFATINFDVEFAVAILEGKPVFVGDQIWIKNNPYPVNWKLFDYWKDEMSILSQDWTWIPFAKKRTFVLNGVELPCPVNVITEHRLGTKQEFYFSSLKDRNDVALAIYDILTEARDKE